MRRCRSWRGIRATVGPAYERRTTRRGLFPPPTSSVTTTVKIRCDEPGRPSVCQHRLLAVARSSLCHADGARCSRYRHSTGVSKCDVGGQFAASLWRWVYGCVVSLLDTLILRGDDRLAACVGDPTCVGKDPVELSFIGACSTS